MPVPDMCRIEQFTLLRCMGVVTEHVYNMLQLFKYEL